MSEEKRTRTSALRSRSRSQVRHHSGFIPDVIDIMVQSGLSGEESFLAQLPGKATGLDLKHHVAARLGMTHFCQQLVVGTTAVLNDTALAGFWRVDECLCVNVLRVPYVEDAQMERELRLKAKRGDARQVECLLGKPIAPDLNIGLTALQIACRYGRNEIVSLLIQARADMSRQDENGKNAMHWAAEQGHLQTMSILHNAGSPLEDWALLIYAAVRKPPPVESGHKDFLRILSDVSVATACRALYLGIEMGNLELVQILLDAGVDKDNVWRCEDEIGGFGPVVSRTRGLLLELRGLLTPLHCAVVSRNLEMVRCLCKAGAKKHSAGVRLRACEIASPWAVIGVLSREPYSICLENATPIQLADKLGFGYREILKALHENAGEVSRKRARP